MKTVLITGCSKGIGLSITQKFLSEGFTVIGTFRTKNKDLTELETQYGQNLKLYSLDLSNLSAIEQFNQDVIQKLQPTILVNNAALSQHKPFLDISISEWQTMFNTNFFSVVKLTQNIIPIMKQKKFGRIITISSVGGQWGGVKQVHYAATKASLINLTHSLAKNFSADGITSNCVSPGAIDTDMLKPELPIEPQKLEQFLKSIPVGRLGHADEVSHTVFFLASEQAAYITGQTVNVNGGIFFG